MTKVHNRGSQLNPTLNNGQCVVFGVHAFVLRVSSVFGMAPLRFTAHHNGFIVSFSIPMCIYSYLLVTSLVALTIFGLISEVKLGINSFVHMTSRLSQVMSCCDFMMVIILGASGVFGAPSKMRRMIEFMNILSTVDKSIGKEYFPANYRTLRTGFLFFMFCFTVTMVTDISNVAFQAREVNREWDLVLHYLGFHLLWYLIVIQELQFTFTAMMVYARFKAVNEALTVTAKYLSNTNIQKEKNQQPLSFFTVQVAPVNIIPDKTHIAFIRKSVTGEPRLLLSTTDAVHHIALLHGKLCDVVRLLENSYSVSLIILLVSTLFHLIITPYFVISEIHVNVTDGHWTIFVILQLAWYSIHVLRLFMMVEPCHYTIEESNKTVSLVCHMMLMCPTKGALTSRLELFSRQLMLQPVCYKPMGACTLDRTLITAIFGAVTTYLVILLQFQRYEY